MPLYVWCGDLIGFIGKLSLALFVALAKYDYTVHDS